MKLKKNIVLIVGGSVSALILLAVAALLFQFRSSYMKVRRDFDASMSKLDSLNRRDPFPSAENVSIVQSNMFLLQNFYDELLARLRKGQTEPVQMEAARFANTLQNTIQKLHSRAVANNIKLPTQRFSFGFEKYALGDLPAQADVPRLTVQLQMIDDLCDLLFKAKVTEVMGVGRQVFEQKDATAGAPAPTAMPGPMPGAPMFAGPSRSGGSVATSTDAISVPLLAETADSSGLYERERFVVRFKARDSAVWDLLNAINRGHLFILIVGMDLSNTDPVVKQFTPANPDAIAKVAPVAGMGFDSGAGSALTAKPVVLGPEERIVAGKEEVIMTITLDVYRFLTVMAQEGSP